MKFLKVSLEQFEEDLKKCQTTVNDAEVIYNNIKLPKRATQGSAGYDFYAPYPVFIAPNETVTIPTGIRASLDKNTFLLLAPRSGLGFKYRLRLDNTIGIIDYDYFFSSNSGHIMAKITNEGLSGKSLLLEAGQGFMQGIILPYYTTEDDDCTAVRNGGFGSTDKKN